VSVTTGASPAPARPGRPPTGARERILDACLEVLKADGYAGLTFAKVAARAGENKALISYHFGSKQGLVAAAGRELGEAISDEILGGLAGPGARTVEGVVGGALEGLWELMDSDERLPRVYFDLNAISVVEGGVREVMREIKAAWRGVLSDLLKDAGVPPRRAASASVLVIAGLEGLSLERIERGDTPEVRRAGRMFVRAMADQLAG
jgi:AcrR family transcriptional regulator